jgi:serine/threonine-protein kinase
MRSTSAVAIVLALALATPALADPSAADAATARKLFDDARKLMKKGDYATACPKLEEGVRLNPGIGMRFNLASCYEGQGRTASAWSLYLDVAAAAKLAKQPEREKEARKAAAKLEPKLSTLTITIEERVPGIEVKRDGTVVGDAALGTAAPMDPGPHTIEATAPEHDPWTTTIEIKPDKDKQTVSVPKLKKTYKPPPPPPPAAPPPPGLGPTKTTALILGGAGVIGLGVGIFFGARALSLNDQSDQHCADNVCDPEGFELRTDARRWGSASSVAIIAGSVGVAAAAVLWFTAPSPDRDKPKDKASIQPWIGWNTGGLSVAGAF